MLINNLSLVDQVNSNLGRWISRIFWQKIVCYSCQTFISLSLILHLSLSWSESFFFFFLACFMNITITKLIGVVGRNWEQVMKFLASRCDPNTRSTFTFTTFVTHLGLGTSLHPPLSSIMTTHLHAPDGC